MNNIDTPPTDGLNPKEPSKDNGSLGLGIGLAWVIAVIGTPLCLAIQANDIIGGRVALLWLLPFLLIVILAIVQYWKGKPRTGLGFILGLISMIAVVLLLVAACFGMMK